MNTDKLRYRLAKWVTTQHGWGLELDGILLGTVSIPKSDPPGLEYQRLVWQLRDLGKVDRVWVPMWPNENADIHLYQGGNLLRMVHYDHSIMVWTVGLYTADRHDTAEKAMEAAEATL